MAKIKQILIVLTVLSGFVFFMGKAQAADTANSTGSPLQPPTLIAPNEQTITAKPKPLITGLVKSGATVLFYIDGVYNGKITNITHISGTANFAYKPFLNLKVGSHTAWAVAQDDAGNKTGISNVLGFKIEHPMPAPTMYKPVVNYKSTTDRPFIVGLAKNNSNIKVFIDKKLVGEFPVKNDESGTANFAFKPKLALERGTHLIYTTATDSRGKESIWSNLIWYKVAKPAISADAEENKPRADNNQKNGAVLGEKIGDENASSTEQYSGILDESRHNQSKVSGNLVVFILFLLGVIGWIFWVNKELIKEKSSSAPEEKMQDAASLMKGLDAYQNPTKIDNQKNFPNNQKQK